MHTSDYYQKCLKILAHASAVYKIHRYLLRQRCPRLNLIIFTRLEHALSVYCHCFIVTHSMSATKWYLSLHRIDIDSLEIHRMIKPNYSHCALSNFTCHTSLKKCHDNDGCFYASSVLWIVRKSICRVHDKKYVSHARQHPNTYVESYDGPAGGYSGGERIADAYQGSSHQDSRYSDHAPKWV